MAASLPIGVAAAYEPSFAALGAVLFLIVAVGTVRPDIALACAVAGPFFIRPLGEDAMQLSPSIVTAIPTGCAAVAVLGFILRSAPKASRRRFDPFHLCAGAFVVVGLASAAANHTSAPMLAESLRASAGYFVVFYAAAVSGMPSAWFTRLVWLLTVGIAVQLPVQLYQMAEYPHVSWDTRVGTLGSQMTDALGVLAVMIACLVVGIAIETKSRPQVWLATALCFEVLLEMIVAEAKFGVVMLPIAVLVTICTRLSLKRVVALVTGTVVGLFLR